MDGTNDVIRRPHSPVPHRVTSTNQLILLSFSCESQSRYSPQLARKAVVTASTFNTGVTGQGRPKFLSCRSRTLCSYSILFASIITLITPLSSSDTGRTRTLSSLRAPGLHFHELGLCCSTQYLPQVFNIALSLPWSS